MHSSARSHSLLGSAFAAVALFAPSAMALPRPDSPHSFPLRNAAPAGSLSAQLCGSPGSLWTLTPSGSLISTATGLCATSDAVPIQSSTSISMAACDPSRAAAQSFMFDEGNQTIYSAAYPTQCVNLAGYGTNPGAQAWFFECDSSDCEGNCAWVPTPESGGGGGGGGEGGGGAAAPFTNASLVNPASSLCLQDGEEMPPLPHTCELGSPSYALPFCDPALPLQDRVSDLLARLTPAQKVDQFSIPASSFKYGPGLNIKGFLWDITCMRGIAPGALDPNPNVTVFPHAIALGATFDADLVARIGAATALEGRIVNQINYRLSGGTSWQAVNCDGGPLANTIHDPRWGRVSETYGEDPFLVAVMGSRTTLSLQNRSSDGRWINLAQVTRHYLGYHGASDLPHDGEELIDLFSFSTQQELPYRTNQVQGGAEGIMCAISAFSIGPRSEWGTSLAPLIPSCVHPFLWAKLRGQPTAEGDAGSSNKLRINTEGEDARRAFAAAQGEEDGAPGPLGDWDSDCYVQTDCCSSIDSMVSPHHYFPDLATAILNSLEMGVQGSYGPGEGIEGATLAMLQNGTLDADLLDQRIARTLETRFRLGEFDINRNPDFPYQGPFDETQLDGPAHRALAREAAAASVVLLSNAAGLLPLALGAGKTLGVVGPFADCSVIKGGYGNWDSDSPFACSYLHSYAGYTSKVTTILEAAQGEGASKGFAVQYAQGSNILTALDGGIAAATAVASSADVVLLVVGLGSLVEHEGFDRTALTLPAAQQALVDAVLAAAGGGSKVVLVVVSAGAADTSYESAGAAVQAFYGGEEAGSGLFDVLSGRVNPSGRLPITVYRQSYLSLLEPLSVFAMISEPSGVGRTYRFQNASAALPAAQGGFVHYWHGYGLSYTRFKYSNLTVALASPFPLPGSDDLTAAALVTVTVTNTGGMDGAEVAQVYVAVPATNNTFNLTSGAPLPRYGLWAFSKTAVLAANGGSTVLTFAVPLRAFQAAGINGGRVVPGGAYTVSVSGHTPDDAAGIAASSNVVSQVVNVVV